MKLNLQITAIVRASAAAALHPTGSMACPACGSGSLSWWRENGKLAIECDAGCVQFRQVDKPVKIRAVAGTGGN